MKIMEDGTEATHVVYINCSDNVQYSFASHLSTDFLRKGVYTYVNCNGTLDVIKRASAFVVVLTKNYLSSTSCLNNLVSILRCRRKDSRLVVPVFYGVSPSEFVVSEHESADRIREWNGALQELTELPSHQSREECSESELVEEIVKDVYEQLYPTENIGIDSRLLEVEHLVCKQRWGIRRIGIWGMPGIGKTTLAKALCNQIAEGYEASCFIEQFDKAFHEKGLHRLLEEKFGKVPRGRLSKKRHLVVLDDVQNPLVAASFLGGLHWFGPGSLIIVTSRDKEVFRLCEINHVFEAQSLNKNEALQLFSQCAFGKNIREQELHKFSMEMIDYADGNPLALRFYAKSLRGKKQSEMEMMKRKLRTLCNIPDLFRSSYETLDDNEKNIFLDIACFFNGENIDYVMQLLEGCGFFPHVGIDVLLEKCLVTISKNRVKMHNLIQDFGREIINRETCEMRLWEPSSIKFLLEDDEFKENRDASSKHDLCTEEIKGIFLDASNLFFDVKPSAFKDMYNLRFLKIYCSGNEKLYRVCLPKGLVSLPYELRLLHWENYPLQSLPEDFDPRHLVELNMPYSQLQKLWVGHKNIKKLKIIRLCHSLQLTDIDSICKAQDVEVIDLQGCTKLQSFPATGQLQHLRVVNLSGCREITSFPELSPNVEELHLLGTGIREFPMSSATLSQEAKVKQKLSNLLTELSSVSSALNIEQLTSLVKINSSNQHLGKLVCLNMKDCSHLQSLPNMVDLESLKVFNISGCSELEHIQGFPRNVKELYIAGTAIKELPKLPQSLEVLNAHGCLSLRSIPFSFKKLPRHCTFSNCFALSDQVVSEYLKNALAYVECSAKEYQLELNKSVAFGFSFPSPAKREVTFNLQSGYCVLIRLSPSWRSTLLGFVILVEAAFSEDTQKSTVFGFKCVCRWKDKEGHSHRLEKTFHCWTPGEDVQKFQKEHMFLFCDLSFNLRTNLGKDPDILADLIVFEIFPVDKEMKLLEENCTVRSCGVHVITTANEDTSLTTSQSVLSLDSSKMVSDHEVEKVVRGLDEKDRNVFLYIACLLNDEEADLVAPFITSIGLGVSSVIEVIADKSLICVSTFGVIVPQDLLGPMGKEIVRRQSMPSVNLNINQTPSVHSGEFVGIEDIADMSSLPSSKSEKVKTFGTLGLAGKGKEIDSSMVERLEPVEPPTGFRGQKIHYYTMCETLFEINTKYVPINPIGRGYNWVACSAINKETNKKVVIKKILNVFEKRINAVRILKDMNLLRHVRHDNIIVFSDIMLSDHKTSFKDVYIVYELMDTDLHQLIKSSQSLSDDHCRFFMFQLLRGLKYLHSLNIIHSDLKPKNLLVNASCDLKLSDFGNARTRRNHKLMTEYEVTHQAPELLLCCEAYGPSVDIWSVGCIFAEILGRKPIFPGTEPLNQLELIINVLGSQQESDLQFVTNLKAQNYIKSLPFSKGTHFSDLYPEANPLAIDLLQRMLVFDPTKRITVNQALLHPYMEELFDSKHVPPTRVPNILHIDENMDEHTIREMMWNEMLYYRSEAAGASK